MLSISCHNYEKAVELTIFKAREYSKYICVNKSVAKPKSNWGRSTATPNLCNPAPTKVYLVSQNPEHSQNYEKIVKKCHCHPFLVEDHQILV